MGANLECVGLPKSPGRGDRIAQSSRGCSKGSDTTVDVLLNTKNETELSYTVVDNEKSSMLEKNTNNQKSKK